LRKNQISADGDILKHKYRNFADMIWMDETRRAINRLFWLLLTVIKIEYRRFLRVPKVLICWYHRF